MVQDTIPHLRRRIHLRSPLTTTRPLPVFVVLAALCWVSAPLLAYGFTVVLPEWTPLIRVRDLPIAMDICRAPSAALRRVPPFAVPHLSPKLYAPAGTVCGAQVEIFNYGFSSSAERRLRRYNKRFMVTLRLVRGVHSLKVMVSERKRVEP